MNPTLIALKLILDTLHIPIYPAFATHAQAGILLAQSYGIIGDSYHFNTSQNAPYSSRLANDFDELCGTLEAGDRTHYDKSLIPALATRLTTILPNLEPPVEFSLGRGLWLALLAQKRYLSSNIWILGRNNPAAQWTIPCLPADHRRAEQALRKLAALESNASGHHSHTVRRQARRIHSKSTTTPV